MAYEVKDKWNGNIIVHKVKSLTTREGHSNEINEKFGEGGGLNAGYDVVEAVAIYANKKVRLNGKEYGKDFIFKSSGTDDEGDDTIVFETKE